MSEAKLKEKPYGIPKQLVWEAYQRVKANRGAAGVDGQSLAMFEKDLQNNLYKIWNRMSSGSCFPLLSYDTFQLQGAPILLVLHSIFPAL